MLEACCHDITLVDWDSLHLKQPSNTSHDTDSPPQKPHNPLLDCKPARQSSGQLRAGTPRCTTTLYCTPAGIRHPRPCDRRVQLRVSAQGQAGLIPTLCSDPAVQYHHPFPPTSLVSTQTSLLNNLASRPQCASTCTPFAGHLTLTSSPPPPVLSSPLPQRSPPACQSCS